MNRRVFAVLAIAVVGALFVGRVGAEEKNPVVIIETSMGTIEAELFADKAPETVKNFLMYTNEKFFDGTIFHRVIPTFMIQGGGFTAELKEKATKASIKNEADNGLKNVAGTLAMARLQDPDSANAQFFINVADNDFLNHRAKTARGWGYAVFGKVVKGMDVVNKIKDTPTKTTDATIQNQTVQMENVPVETVTIKSISVKK
jgi:cyclophilin family peptidyl-prolyl cis-trans isomerase